MVDGGHNNPPILMQYCGAWSKTTAGGEKKGAALGRVLVNGRCLLSGMSKIHRPDWASSDRIMPAGAIVWLRVWGQS
jgi:hypothetical protein